jgi:hypothetical protein
VAIILGHQEYVTQKEYDNLKAYVYNGGILLRMDSNILYSEVKYSYKTKKVTLVKGHNWAFDGKSEWRSTGERWDDDISKWIGGKSIGNTAGMILDNNPVGDEHREEQYMTNPQDKILLDYNASLLDHNDLSANNTATPYPHNASSSLKNPKIATCEQLRQRKGNIIRNLFRRSH